MSIILTVHKAESYVGHRSSKYEQTHKSMLISSDVPKKPIAEIFILFIDLNESDMLQVYFAKTGRTTLRITVFNFSFEL